MEISPAQRPYMDSKIEVAFSPWSIFDDYRGDVLVINAYPTRMQQRLFRQSEELQRLLAVKSGESIELSDWLVEELVSLGVIARGAPPVVPRAPHAAGQFYRKAFLNRVEVEVELGNDPGRQVHELRGLCAAVGREGEEGLTLALTLYGASGVDAARVVIGSFIEGCGLTNIPAGRREIRWRRPVGQSGLAFQGLEAFLEEFGVQLIVEDLVEVKAHCEGESQLNEVRELAERGFLVPIAIPTRCGSDLLDRIRAWEHVTEFSGVHIEPLVTDSCAGTAVRPIDNEAEFEQARLNLQEAAAVLGSSLLRSEPWASILVNAALPGIAREGMSKQVSSAFLASSGRWARTREHAAYFLFSSPAQLLPGLFRDKTAHVIAYGEPVQGLPECERCPFGPLCDGFWRPEIDLLRRTGRGARAAKLAALECGLRMHALSSLIGEIRHDQAQGRSNGRVRASYDKGHLTLDRS